MITIIVIIIIIIIIIIIVISITIIIKECNNVNNMSSITRIRELCHNDCPYYYENVAMVTCTVLLQLVCTRTDYFTKTNNFPL